MARQQVSRDALRHQSSSDSSRHRRPLANGRSECIQIDYSYSPLNNLPSCWTCECSGRKQQAKVKVCSKSSKTHSVKETKDSTDCYERRKLAGNTVEVYIGLLQMCVLQKSDTKTGGKHRRHTGNQDRWHGPTKNVIWRTVTLPSRFAPGSLLARTQLSKKNFAAPIAVLGPARYMIVWDTK